MKEEIKSLMDFPEPEAPGLIGRDHAPGDIATTVNPFTGEAVPVIPLLSLPQVGSLRLDISLRYSSNIKDKLLLENDDDQGGWVGFGWALNFGRIVTGDRQTVSGQQQFFLEVGATKEEILWLGDAYCLKGHPSWKIEAQKYTLDASTGIMTDSDSIKAWVVTTDRGVVYQYGGDSAHWCGLVTDGNRVLTVANAFPTQDAVGYLTYSWEIHTIKNPHNVPGGEIRFTHWKDEVYHSSLARSAVSGRQDRRLCYTRAVYPKLIEDSLGRAYEFILQPRDAREYIDPTADGDRAEGWQSIYQRRRLKEIRLYERLGGALRRKVSFEYQSSIGAGRNYKKLLSEVTIEDGDRHALPPYRFSYKLGRGSTVNRGALSEIVYPNGGRATYRYKAQPLSRSELSFKQEGLGPNDVVRVLGNTLVILKCGDTHLPGSGQLPGWLSGEIDIYAYHWDGCCWQGGLLKSLENVLNRETPHPFAPHLDNPHRLEFHRLQLDVSNKFFVVACTCAAGTVKIREKLVVFHYDAETRSWEEDTDEELEWLSSSSGRRDEFRLQYALGRRYLALLERDNLYRWRWMGSGWQKSSCFKVKREPSVFSDNDIVVRSYRYLTAHEDYFLAEYIGLYQHDDRLVPLGRLERHYFHINGWHDTASRFYPAHSVAGITNVGRLWAPDDDPRRSLVCLDFCVFHYGKFFRWNASGQWATAYHSGLDDTVYQSMPGMDDFRLDGEIIKMEACSGTSVIFTQWAEHLYVPDGGSFDLVRTGSPVPTVFHAAKWTGRHWKCEVLSSLLENEELPPIPSHDSSGYEEAVEEFSLKIREIYGNTRVMVNDRYGLLLYAGSEEAMAFPSEDVGARPTVVSLNRRPYTRRVLRWTGASWSMFHESPESIFCPAIRRAENGIPFLCGPTGTLDSFGTHEYDDPVENTICFRVIRPKQDRLDSHNISIEPEKTDWFVLRKRYLLRNVAYPMETGLPDRREAVRLSLYSNGTYAEENDFLEGFAMERFRATSQSTENVIVIRELQKAVFEHWQHPSGSTGPVAGSVLSGAIVVSRVVRETFHGHPMDYPVERVVVDDRRGNQYETSFTYASGQTDENGHTAQYATVTMRLPGGSGPEGGYPLNGSIVSCFFNGLAPSSTDDEETDVVAAAPDIVAGRSVMPADYVRLSGLVHQRYFLDCNGRPVKKEQYGWLPVALSSIGGVYRKLLVTEHVEQDGVTAKILRRYNDRGLLKVVSEHNGGREGWKQQKLDYLYEDSGLNRSGREAILSNNLLAYVTRRTIYGADAENSNNHLPIVYARSWINWVWSEHRLWQMGISHWIGKAGESVPESPEPRDAETVRHYRMNRVAEVIDPEQRKTAYKWGYNNYYGLPAGSVRLLSAERNHLVGIFRNASAQECLICDFEDGTEQGLDSGWANLWYGTVFSREAAFAGRRGLSIRSAADNAASRLLKGLTVGRRYRVEVKTRGVNGALYFLLLKLGRILDRSFDINVTRLWQSARWTFTARAETVEFRLCKRGGANAVVFCDHLRVYPDKALARTYTVDPFSGNVLAEFDENHVATLYYYDAFGRLLETRNEDGALLASQHYYYQEEPVTPWRRGSRSGGYSFQLGLEKDVVEVCMDIPCTNPDGICAIIGRWKIERREHAWHLAEVKGCRLPLGQIDKRIFGRKAASIITENASYHSKWRFVRGDRHLAFYNGSRKIFSVTDDQAPGSITLFSTNPRSGLDVKGVAKRSRNKPNYLEAVSFPNGNLLYDWSFEREPFEPPMDQKAKGWRYPRAKLSWSADSYFGEKSLRLDIDRGKTIDLSQAVYVQAGKSYWATIWFKASESSVIWLEAGSERLTEDAVGSGRWQKHTGCYRPEKDGEVPFKIRCGSLDAGAHVLLDGALVSQSCEPDDPVASRDFFDGMGRTFQRQWLMPPAQPNTAHDTGAVYYEYDNAGSPSRSWMPICSAFTVQGAISAPLNFLGEASRKCLDFYGARQEDPSIPVDGKPHADMLYCQDPLRRLRTFYPPGTFFHTDTHSYSNLGYGPAAEDDPVGLIDPRLPASGYTRQVFHDANGTVTTRWYDAFGGLAGWTYDPGHASEGHLNLTTLLRRDPMGRIVESIPPSAFELEPETGAISAPQRRNHARRYVYDSLGRRIIRDDPDQGKEYTIYDRTGRTRYKQDESMLLHDDPMPVVFELVCAPGQEARSPSHEFTAGSQSHIECDLRLWSWNQASRRPADPDTPCDMTFVLTISDPVNRKELTRKHMGMNRADAAESPAILQETIPLPWGCNRYRLSARLRNRSDDEMFADARIEGRVTPVINSGYHHPRFKVFNYDPFARLQSTALFEGSHRFDRQRGRPALDADFDQDESNRISAFLYDDDYCNAPGKNHCRGRLSKAVCHVAIDGERHSFEEAYQYNRQGRVVCRRITIPGLGRRTIFDRWNLQGRLVKRSLFPDAAEESLHVWYCYDPRGRLCEILTSREDDRRSAKPAAGFQYGCDDKLKCTLSGDSDPDRALQRIEYRYNVRGWMAGIHSQAFGLTLCYQDLDGFPLADNRDFTGSVNRASWRYGTGSQKVSAYAYDRRKRLLSETNYTRGSNGHEFDETTVFNYDPNGNLTLLTRQGSITDSIREIHYPAGMCPNQAQYVDADMPKYWFRHDLCGRLVLDPLRSGMRIFYDARGMPEKLTWPDDQKPSIQLVYDHRGQLVGHLTDGGASYHFIRDGNGQVLAVFCNGRIQHWNLYGNGMIGRVVARYDGNTGGFSGVDTEYYLCDHVGRIRVILDSSGTEISRFDYYPFGDIKHKGGRNPAPLLEQHTGQPYDMNHKMSYLGVRIQGTELGRWLQPEPLSDTYPDVSPYCFSGNNPVNYIDPTGYEDLRGGSFFVLENPTGLWGPWLEDETEAAAPVLDMKEGFENKWAKKDDIRESFKTAESDDIIAFLGHAYHGAGRTGIKPATYKPFYITLDNGTNYETDQMVQDLNLSPGAPAIVFLLACDSDDIAATLSAHTDVKIVIGTDGLMSPGAARETLKDFYEEVKKNPNASIGDIVRNLNKSEGFLLPNLTVHGTEAHKKETVSQLLTE